MIKHENGQWLLYNHAGSGRKRMVDIDGHS